jgi:uncharacterized delta-60 repeat protein
MHLCDKGTTFVNNTRPGGISSRTPSLFERLERRQLMSTGMLDPKFGTGGNVPIGFVRSDVAVDSAGRTVVLGGMAGDFALLRLNPNGTPDATFGTNGLVTTDFGGKRFDFAQRVAIQSDGKIVVAGVAVNSGGVDHPFNGHFVLARYNPNGSLDASFGDGGTESVLGNLTTDGVGAIKIQSDGNIVFAGNRQHDDSFDFITFRLQPNGSLDGTFGDARGSGSAGYVNTGIGDHGRPSALVIQSDGNIVVGGTKDVLSDELNRDELALVRYTPAGKLDRSFDGDGKLLATYIGDASLYAMSAQPDGRLLVAGSVRGRDGRTRVLLTRFLNDGSTDNTLGTGTIVADILPGHSSWATNVFARGDKIVIVGAEQASGQYENAFATQYLRNGSLDTSFGTDGVAHMNIAGGALSPRAALAPDGKVVFAYEGGTTRGGVARFVQVVPKAYVVANGFITTEGKDTGSFRVGRDAQYDFSTRVYIKFSGDAIYGKDYTADLTIPPVPVDTLGNPIDLHGIVLDSPVQGYVDIPAGRSEVTVSVNPINNSQIEPTKQATFILFDNPNYARNQLLQDTFVRIFDDDDARIDFEAKTGGTVKAGDRADFGQKFGDRGNGLQYGWDVDNTGNARNRGNKRSPDLRFDSLNHMQRNGANRKWEIAVPNGLYAVTVVAGDPNATDSVYRINVEGQLALSGTPTGDIRWFTRTMNVMVTDGRLTVTNGAGAVNNKIAYLEIKNPTYGAEPGTVTPDTGIRLKPAPGKKPAQRAFVGFAKSFFSEQAIDGAAA